MAVAGARSVQQILTPNLQNLSNTDNTVENSESVNFGDILKATLQNLESLQTDAANKANDFAVGKTDSIQDVTISAQKADIAFQFAVQIRNKVLDAYSEIMRMQI